MIFTKIKKAFVHSDFFRNYETIPNDVLVEYKSIKNYYKESKLKLRKEIKYKLFNFIHKFFIYNVDDEYLENFILYLIEEYSFDKINKLITKLNDDLIDKIYNLNAIKLLVQDDINDEKFIYDNCSPDYYVKNPVDKNRLKSNTRMCDFFKKVEIRDDILIKKIKLDCNIDNYLNRFQDLEQVLILASESGNIKHIKNVIKKGANIHTDNDLSLKKACEKGKFKIVKFLVENGANIHVNDDYALKISCTKGYIKIVKFLIENGANIYVRDDCIIKNVSIKADKNGNDSMYIDIIKLLIKSDVVYFKNEQLTIDIINKHQLQDFYDNL